MTGFASGRGDHAGWSWTWDLRSVNGRGLDIRLRLPDWIDGLEPPVRQVLQKSVGRGNVTLSLRVSRSDSAGAAGLDHAALVRTIALLREIEDLAATHDLAVRHATAAEIATLPGVLTAADQDEDVAALRAALLDDLPALIAAFQDSRDREGAATHTVIAAQVDRIAALTADAASSAALRPEAQARALKAGVARLVEASAPADPDRLAQELALLAVKSDVTEEIDRLTAHVEAARALLAGEGPKGRKLDFLTQEFNREANTLCSKSGFAALTAIGLEMKAAIDQMREQVQNVE